MKLRRSLYARPVIVVGWVAVRMRGVSFFDQPVLVEGGGEGSEGGRLGRGAIWDLWLAVQPLPPPGPLAFVCAWPGRGIPETRVEVDAAVRLWADGPYCSAD